MTTNSLLPPNSTPEERALEVAMRPGLDVEMAIELIRTAKESAPDDWLYWLIWEYGLEELLPYVANPRTVLSDGLQWQRIRGTPDSLKLAFGWIGLGQTKVEEEDSRSRHWFEYQLEPPRIPTPAELKNLVGLARLSAPVGTRLARIYKDYDLRRAIYDKSKWSDGSLYSADSGVYDPTLGAIVSFGQRITSYADGSDQILYAQHLQTEASQALYNDHLIWSVGVYDGEPPILNYPFELTTEVTVLGQGVGRNLRVMDGFESFGQGLKTGGGEREEQPQFPSTVTDESYTVASEGWGSSTWGDRTWNQPITPE